MKDIEELENLKEQFEVASDIVDWLTQNGVPFLHAMLTLNMVYKQKLSIVEAFFTMQYEIQKYDSKQEEQTEKNISTKPCC